MLYTTYLPACGEVLFDTRNLSVSAEERIHIVGVGRTATTKEVVTLHFTTFQPPEDAPRECGYIYLLWYVYQGAKFNYCHVRSIHA